jgi:hypothetical protein
MNDAFDTLISESLHHAAATVPHRGAGFSDVRRRVRRRRQRNVVAMSLPAVLGVAAIGLHSTPRQTGLQAGAGDDTAPGTALAAPTTTITELTPTTIAELTPTTSFANSNPSGTTTTVPADMVGEVVCLNATGDASNAFVRGCQLTVGGGKWLTAPKVDTMTFVMALDPIAASEAVNVAATIGIYVHPLDLSYLPTDVDLSKTAAKVVVVVGTSLPPSSTIYTGVPTTSTSVAP